MQPLHAGVSLEPVDSAETYDVVASVTAPVLRCGSGQRLKPDVIIATGCVLGSTARAWLVLEGDPESVFGTAAHFMAELKFRVVEIDPTSGEIEDHQDGFREEYPLEDIEIATADFIAKVSCVRIHGSSFDARKANIVDFRKVWDSLDKDQEVLQRFSLNFKDMQTAIDEVISCLGMQRCTELPF